ncbi:MAG: sigma-70 family RNA polymerase sigma factor [bacterium]|nr:sigma-70 family RNA polymerase sigma factor [bacterium]
MSSYFSQHFSQTSLRKKPNDAASEGEKRRLDVTLPDCSADSAAVKQLIVEATIAMNGSIISVILPDYFEETPEYLVDLFKQMKIKESRAPQAANAADKTTFATRWETLNSLVLARIKFTLLQRYIEHILTYFQGKITQIARSYIRHLPRHVAEGEGDDLITIAQLEFVETFKVWDPEKATNIWPLAYTRITGAMKDHIRYVTRSDPSRLYDWINDAGYVLMLNQEEHNFEDKIETGIQLNRALKVLSVREKRIVVAYAKQDETFQTIATKLKLSESQVSRIYKKAIDKMKREIAKGTSID